MSFFSICWERKQLGGACLMHVPANVPYVFIREYPNTGCVVLCVSVCAVFHTSPPLLSFWQDYLISVGLSTLHCLHHVCASHSPRKSLDSHYTSCSIYFFVSTTPSFHFVSKTILETELGEALNDKEIYLKSDRGMQLILWTSRAWYTTVTPEKWPRDATSTLTLNSPGRNWYKTFFLKVTAGGN